MERESLIEFRLTQVEWSVYLRDLAIRNTFLGRPVLRGCDWRLKPLAGAVQEREAA